MRVWVLIVLTKRNQERFSTVTKSRRSIRARFSMFGEMQLASGGYRPQERLLPDPVMMVDHVESPGCESQ